MTSMRTEIILCFFVVVGLLLPGCQTQNQIVKDVDEVRVLLQRFQEGYSKRDIEVVDEFMELFSTDEGLEVIGTGAVAPRVGEWCLDRACTQNLIESDWKYWGDLSLQVEGARIHVNDDVAWLATSGTVTMWLGEDELEEYVWPMRFTAVAVREEGGWRFRQMQFSFPTSGIPDVRW